MKKYSKDYLTGFKVALMLTDSWDESMTDEKISEMTEKFTKSAKDVLGKKKIEFEKKQTFLKVSGKPYHCPCGSNLFTQYEEKKWRCNNCENHFELA